jgi:probable rRNA maturation factor
MIRRGVLAARPILKPALRDLSVAIVGSKRMAALHKEFLGQTGATDVLTFELEHDRRGRVISGEVVICAAVAARWAKRNGHSVGRELLLYALHGLLHLCGWDDKTETGFAKMHAKEDQILKQIGVGPVFGRSRGGGR